MVTRIGSCRRKSRNLLIWKKRLKSRIPIRRLVGTFKEGDTVVLKVHPSYHKGMYHLRFHGATGKVVSMQGNCCKVSIKDGKKRKMLLVHPVHLKGVQ